MDKTAISCAADSMTALSLIRMIEHTCR